MIVNEDYVSFETAKLLMEKGFEGKMYTFYTEEGTQIESAYVVPSNFFPIYRPTLQMAMKWLRDVHNYHICPCLDSYVYPFNNEYYIVIRKNKDKFEEISPCEEVYFKTYEEAAEAGIKYTLENLI